MTMKLITGLGNPGFFYSRNRHNIGFMCIRHLARMQGIKLNKKQGYARTGHGEIAGENVVLARPQTFMNASGESIGRLVNKLKINPSDLIVIHDDLDLPPGKIRLRFGGSSGGHKGVDSIIAHLGSQDFTRIRIGIGRPDMIEGPNETKEADIIAYVLSDFTPDEKKTIAQVIPKVSEAILCFLKEGLTSAMNKYN